MKPIDSERLENLLLARLASGKPPRLADARKSLYTLLARDRSSGEWQELFASTLAALREAGAVQPEQLVLTGAGRARLARALRLRELPTVPSWAQFRRRYLPRLFLALPDSATAPNCTAAVLARRLGVSYDGRSTPARVVDAWLASTLGLQKVSLEELRRQLLARELQLPARRSTAELLRLAATQLADSPRADPNSVLDALTRRWLLEGPEPSPAPAVACDPGSSGAAPGAPNPAALGDEALRHFARRVQLAAESPEARSFGAGKVFIGSVWRALAAEPEMARLGPDGFKRLLVEAHRRGSLVLAAADLVSAMDPHDVSASETRHDNATYHFIQRGQPA